MRKKCIVFMLVLSLTLLYPLSKSEGVFGIGDVVFDPSNIIQMIIDYAVQLEQLAQEVIAVEQLILQYQVMLLNIKNLNFSGLPVVGGLFDHAMHLFEDAQSIVYNAAMIKAAFDELWAPFRVNVMAGADFYLKAFDWNEQVRRAHLDVMTLQNSVPVNLAEMSLVVKESLGRSAASEGNLQAQQAGNELLGTANQQLALINQQLSMEATAAGVGRMLEASARDQAQLNAERWMFEFGKVPETSGFGSLPRLR